MPGQTFFAALSPYARVGTAVAPIAIALLLRLLFGKNRLTEILVTAGTMWFVVNVLLAPFSLAMRQELRQVLH